MKRSALTPFYIPVAWCLLISYQSLTQAAVTSVVRGTNSVLPSLASWITAHLDLVVFIHGFAWIFFLTTVIPSILLGREQSVVVQFVFVLVLTLLGVFFTDLLGAVLGPEAVDRILQIASWITHPWLAAAYLATPYLAMLCMDLAERRRKNA